MSAIVVSADDFSLDDLVASVAVDNDVWVQTTTSGARFTHADALVYAADGETMRPGDLLTSGTVPMCCGLKLNRRAKQD